MQTLLYSKVTIPSVFDGGYIVSYKKVLGPPVFRVIQVICFARLSPEITPQTEARGNLYRDEIALTIALEFKGLLVFASMRMMAFLMINGRWWFIIFFPFFCIVLHLRETLTSHQRCDTHG